MNSIRIGSNNIKKIEVNDKGDFIVLNLNDRSFLSRFYDLTQAFSKKWKELEEKEKEYSNLSDEATELFPLGEKADKLLKLDLEVHTFLKERIDSLFGEDSCKKIFGEGVIPSISCYSELFEALAPFIKEAAYAKSKYNPGRVGNV